MYELIFNGKFETKDAKVLIDKIQNVLEETNSTFRGNILTFEVDDYSTPEELKETDENKEEANSDTNSES